MATKNTHEIEIRLKAGSIDTESIKKQIKEAETEAKVELGVNFNQDEFDKSFNKISDGLKRLNKLAELKNGKWGKDDIFSAMLSKSKELTAELSKTNKNETYIKTLQQHLLILANSYKNLRGFEKIELPNIDFNQLFPDSKKNSSNTIKMISQLEDLGNVLKKNENEFGNIKSIPLSDLISDKEVNKLLSSVDSVAEQFAKKFNIKISSYLNIGDFLSKELLNASNKIKEVQVPVKPVIENPEQFTDDAEKQIKDSGAKIGINIKPTLDDDKREFENDLIAIGKELRESDIKLNVGIKPTLYDNDIDDFKDNLDRIATKLSNNGVKLGVTITPDLENIDTFKNDLNKVASKLKDSGVSVNTNNQKKDIDIQKKEESINTSFDSKNSKLTQHFDNQKQKDIVYLENYKNIILEILDLESHQSASNKEKIEQLKQLKDYYASMLSFSQKKTPVKKGVYGLSNEDVTQLRQMVDSVSKKPIVDETKLKTDLIEDNIKRIEDKSEKLRLSLRKEVQDSIKYVDTLKSKLLELNNPDFEGKTPRNYRPLENYIKSIEKDYPELNDIVNNLINTPSMTKDFVNQPEWNEFLSTLPKAQKYLENIGYDFNKVKTATEQANVSTGEYNNKLKENVQIISKDVSDKQSQIKEWEEYKNKINDGGEALLSFVKTYKSFYSQVADDDTPFINFSDNQEKTLQHIKNELTEIYNQRRNFNDQSKYESVYGNEVISLLDIAQGAGFRPIDIFGNNNISKFFSNKDRFKEARELLEKSTSDMITNEEVPLENLESVNKFINERINLLKEEIKLIQEKNRVSSQNNSSQFDKEQTNNNANNNDDNDNDDKSFGFNIKPTIKNNDEFNKQLQAIENDIDKTGKKIGINIKPVLKNEDEFKSELGNIEKKISDSDANISINIKPKIDDIDKFSKELSSIENNLKNNNSSINIEINPSLNDIDGFKSELNTIEGKIAESNAKLNIEIRPILNDVESFKKELQSITKNDINENLETDVHNDNSGSIFDDVTTKTKVEPDTTDFVDDIRDKVNTETSQNPIEVKAEIDNKSFNTLDEKLKYLRDIRSTQNKVAVADDPKKFDIDAANDKLSEFVETWDSVVVRLKNGESININPTLGNIDSNLKLTKKDVEDIDFILKKKPFDIFNDVKDNIQQTEEATKELDNSFESLNDKIEHLKDLKKEVKFLENADDKKSWMEDNAWDVGGNNEKASEAESQRKIDAYENLCEHIETAEDKIYEFQETYDSVILHLKNGEKIELTDIYDITDIPLNKKDIKDIDFVLLSDEDIEDTYEMADAVNKLAESKKKLEEHTEPIEQPMKPVIQNPEETKDDIQKDIGEINIPARIDTDNTDDELSKEQSKNDFYIGVDIKPIIKNKDDFKNSIAEQVGTIEIPIKPNDSDINSIKNNLEKGRDSITSIISEENSAISSIGNTINENVIPAITHKTQTFEEGAMSVINAIEKESTEYFMLVDAVKAVADEFKRISNEITSDDINKLENLKNTIEAISNIRFDGLDFSNINNFLNLLQTKPIDGADSLTNAIDNGITEEDKYMAKTEEFTQDFIKNFKLTKESVESLKQAIYEMFTQLSNGAKNIDTQKIIDIFSKDKSILKQDNQYITQKEKEFNAQNSTSPYQIRSAVRSMKILNSPVYKKDFGDDWKHIRGTIGLGVFSNKEGISIKSALSDLNDTLGTTFDLTANEQGMVKQLYDAITAPIKTKTLFDEIGESVQQFEKNIIHAYETIVSEKESITKKENGSKTELPEIKFEVTPVVSEPDKFKQKILNQVGTIDIPFTLSHDSNDKIEPNNKTLEIFKQQMSALYATGGERDNGYGYSVTDIVNSLGGRFTELGLGNDTRSSIKLDIEFLKDIVSQIDLTNEQALILRASFIDLDNTLENIDFADNNSLDQIEDKILNTSQNIAKIMYGSEYGETLQITDSDIINAKATLYDNKNNFGNSINNEKQMVAKAVEEEKQELSSIATIIDNTIIPSIDRKTIAFEDEAARVLNSVERESSELQILINTITNIINKINEIPDLFTNEDAQTLEGVNNILNDISNISINNLDFSNLEAFLNLSQNDSIKNAEELIKGINKIITNANTLNEGVSDNTAVTIQKISNIMTDMNRLNFTKMDFSSLTRFLEIISGKSKDEIDSFVQNLSRLKRSIKNLSEIKLPTFANSDRFENFINAINKFPSQDKAQKFAISSQYIKQGFDALSQLKELNFTDSTSGILSAVSQLLANSEDLKNLANILKSPAKVVKEAKDNQQVDIQRNIGEATSKLNDATKTYTSEMKENGINAVTQTTKDYYQSVLNIIDGIRNTSGIAKDQIKQLDNAIQSSKDNIAKVEDSILEKQRKAEEDNKKARENELKNIDSKIASGAFGKQIESFHNKLDKFVDKTGKASGEVEELTKQFNIMSNPVSTGDERLKALEKYTASVKTLNGIIDKHNQEMRSNPAYAEEQKGLKELQSEMQNYGSLMERFEDSDFNKKHPEVLKQIKSDYIDVNDAIKNGIDLTEEQVKKLKEENKVLSSTMRYQSSSSDVLDKNFKVSNYNNYDDAYNDVKSYITKTLSSNYEKIIGDISSSTKISEDGVQTITAKVREYGGAVKDVTFQWNTLSGVTTGYARDAGVELTGVTSILDKLRKKTGEIMAYWAGNFLNPFRLIGFVKQGIGIVQQYDDALVELRKVSDETEDSLKRFVNTSFDIGDSVGATALQIQKSTAEFLRLGENLKDATKLAKQATVLFNVSEFANIEDATKAFISMSQAFEDVDENALVDKLNIIGNNFAISTEGLATALKDSAAALRVAGNDLDESIALATAGNRIAQNPEQVGKAVRTIALRLTGTKEAKQQLQEIDAEFEDINMTTSKLRDVIKNATKVKSNDFMGIDILDANGNYKSTYDILLGIANIYDEIVETDKKGGTNNLNLLLETIAGKNRASIAGSIIQSADELKKAYEMSSTEFNGSAQEELNKYLDSITAKITKFTNEIHEFWTGLISSDFVKFFVELGTQVIKLINNFGQLKSVVIAITTALTLKKVGIFGLTDNNGVKNLTFAGKAISDISKSIKEIKAATGSNKVSAFFKSIGSNTPTFSVPTDTLKVYQQIREQAESIYKVNPNAGLDHAVKEAFAVKAKDIKVTDELLGHFIDTENNAIRSSAELGNSFKVFGKQTGTLEKTLSNFGAIATSVFANLAITGATMLIGWGVSKITGIIDDAIHAAERRAERVKKLREEFNSLNEAFNTKKSNIDDFKERFAELSEGVDAAGNNVKLTTSEFDEYHSITKQIADMFPNMVKGFDNQGNAILGVKGNVEALNKALDEEQRKVNDSIILGNENGDIQKNYLSNANTLTGGLYRDYGISVDTFYDFVGDYFNLLSDSIDEGLDEDTINNKLYELTTKFAENNGIAWEDIFTSLESALGLIYDNNISSWNYQKLIDEHGGSISGVQSYLRTLRESSNESFKDVQKFIGAIYRNAILDLADDNALKDSDVALQMLDSILGSVNSDIASQILVGDIDPYVFVKNIINKFETAISGSNSEDLTKAFNELIDGAFVINGDINDKYTAKEAAIAMHDLKDTILKSLLDGVSDEESRKEIENSVNQLFDSYGISVVDAARDKRKTIGENIYNAIADPNLIKKYSNYERSTKSTIDDTLNELFKEYGVNTEDELQNFYATFLDIIEDGNKAVAKNIKDGSEDIFNEDGTLSFEKIIARWKVLREEAIKGEPISLSDFLKNDTNKGKVDSFIKDMSTLSNAIKNFDTLTDEEKINLYNEFNALFPEIAKGGELTEGMLQRLTDAEWKQLDALLEGVEGAEKYREALKGIRDEAKKTSESTIKSRFADMTNGRNDNNVTRGFSNARKELALDWYDNNGKRNVDDALNAFRYQLSKLNFGSLEEMLNDEKFKRFREEYENLVNVFANEKIDDSELQSLMEIYDLSAEDVEEFVPQIYAELQTIMEAFASGAGEVGEDWWEQYQAGLKKASKGADQLFKELNKKIIDATKDTDEESRGNIINDMLKDEYSDVIGSKKELSEVLEDERLKLALETRDKIKEAQKDGLSGEEVTEFMTMFDMTSEQVKENIPNILELCENIISIFGEAGGEAAKEYFARYTQQQEAEGKTVLNRFNEILGEDFIYGNGDLLEEKTKNRVKVYGAISNAEKQAIIKLVDENDKTFEEAFSAMGEHSTEIVSSEIKNVSDMLADDVFSSALSEYEELMEMLQDGISEEEQMTLLEKYGFIPNKEQLKQIESSAMDVIETYAHSVDGGMEWLEAHQKQWEEKTKNQSRELLLGQIDNSDMKDWIKTAARNLTDEELSLLVTLDLDEVSSYAQLREAIDNEKKKLDATGILQVQLDVKGKETNVGDYYNDTISKAQTLATVVNSLRQDRDKGGKYWSDIVEDQATFSQLLQIMPELSEYMSQYSGDVEQTVVAISYLEEGGQKLYDEFVQNTTGLTELDGATDSAKAAFNDLLNILKQITGLDVKGELKDISDSLDKIYFDQAGDQARSFADAVSDVESEINTLQSAYDKLMSVDIKQDSEEFTSLVNSLIQQFPELIGHTDSIEELRNAVARLLNEKGDYLINRLIELRNQEGVTDELRGKIDALIDSFHNLENAPFSLDNTMNVLKDVRGELNQLAKFINEVNATGLHLNMTASDEVFNLYPQLLESAKIYSDGTVELDRQVYEAFIKNREAELKGAIDAKVKELENDNIALQSQINYYDARVKAAKTAIASENLEEMEATLQKLDNADAVLRKEQENDASEVDAYNAACKIISDSNEELSEQQINADDAVLENAQDDMISEVKTDDEKTLSELENIETKNQGATDALNNELENNAQAQQQITDMSAASSEVVQENEYNKATAATNTANEMVRVAGEAGEAAQQTSIDSSSKIQQAINWIGDKANLAAEAFKRIGTNQEGVNMGGVIIGGISKAIKWLGNGVKRAADTVARSQSQQLIEQAKGEVKSFKDSFAGNLLSSIGTAITNIKHTIDITKSKKMSELGEQKLAQALKRQTSDTFDKVLDVDGLIKDNTDKYDDVKQDLKMKINNARAKLEAGIESDSSIIAQLYEEMAKNNYNIELLKANGGIDLQDMAKKLAADAADKSGKGGGSDHTPSGGSGSDRDAADNANEFSEIIDWIEVKIKRLEEEIARLDKIAGNSFENYFDRAKAIEGNLSNVREEIEVTRAAYYRYMMEANNIPLDEHYRELVRQGAIDIEEIRDEELSNAIKSYTEWYDKAIAEQDKLYELCQQVSDLYQSAFDLIQSRADSVLSSFQNASNLINSAVSRIQERGYLVSEKYYEKLVDNAQTQIYILERKHEEMLNMFQEAVDTGAIEEGSQAWYDYKNQVDQVTIAIDEMTNSIIQYNNAIRQLQWDKFDLTQGMVGELSSESDFLINLMSKYDMYSKEGFITNRGMSTKGLHGLNYNVYMQQADEYRREMLDVSRDLANDPNNQTLYNRRKELLELQREMILAAEQEKEALKSLVNDGIQKTLSYLQELISKYGEALDQQKSLYDYQKNIANQTKNITNLQKQLLSLGNDDSEETRKRVQELNNNLNTAQESLQETLYEKAISDQKELLNGLYDEFNETLNARLDNLDVLIAEQIGEINLASGQISDTINTVAGNVGYQITTGVGAVFESSNFNSLPALATYTTELMNELSNDRALITEELTKGQTSTLTNINENAAMIEGYLTGVAAALGYDGKTAASLIGDSVYGINLNAEKIDHISSLLGTGEGSLAENIRNAFSEDLSLLNSVFSGEDSLPNLIGAMVSTLEGALGDTDNNIFKKAFDSSTTTIQNEIQGVKDRVDKMDKFSDVIAAIDLGTGKVGDVINSMGSVNTTLTQIKEMMEKLFNTKATTPDSSKVTASSGSAAANGTGNYTKANVVKATGSGGQTGASTAVNAAKAGTKQGNGRPEVGDVVTFTGSYYYSAWQVKPVGTYLSGQPNAVEIDRDVSSYSGVSKPYHIKKAGTKPGDPWSDMGWVSLDQLKGYYLGTKSVDKDRFAFVNERGAEAIVRPDGSILTPLSKKSMVVDAKATDNMWRMLKDPEKFMSSIFKDTNVISNNNGGNISNDINITIPINSVSDFADFMRQVQNSNEWERMFDAMLNNRLKGTSKFAKYNVSF